MTVKEKINEILKKINEGVIEKEEVLALTLLSSIAGESIFFLGPPGVAKSLIARKLKYVYKDGSSFEYLMNRFSTPDEIFGPVSISKLKDQDKYERIVKNYLPSATVVFLDEIWKAGPSIQNTLLTVLNEKKYRNGDQEIDIPLKSLVSASNELPNRDQGLEALWDRFLIRLIVDGIKDNENFNRMISETLNSYSDTIEEKLKITDEEYEKWSKAIDEIKIPENVFNVIHVIRNYIDQFNQKVENKENQIYISDRRWRKIVRLLRTSAFLNDRISVDLMDCFIINHCLWNESGQINAVSQFVRGAIQKFGYSLKFNFKSLKDELDEFKTEIKEETKFEKDTRVETFIETQGYFELENPPSQHDRFIENNIFKQLTNEKQPIYLFYKQYSSFNRHNQYHSRSGKDKFHITLNDKDYKLKTEITGEKRQITKKPHIKVEEDWDSRVNKYLETTNNFKDQLEAYKNKDLKHLRTNLFANPELANIVESHLADTLKDIEKIEVEIRKIQNDYKKLKDEVIIL
ncbi:MAG: MoxR-like [Bacteroidetes bacterium]|nr:MAG: MoxR-like [Bacteroidota bacterium]